MTDCKIEAAQNNDVQSRPYIPAGPAFLMLVNRNDDIRVALGFQNASGTNILDDSHQLRHLTDSEWVVRVVQSAEEARVVIMGHLGKDLPPL